MGFTMLSVDTGCKAITLTFIIKRYAVCMISRQKTPPVRQSASDAEVCRRSTLLIKQPSCSCFAPLAVRASREMSDINDEFMKVLFVFLSCCLGVNGKTIHRHPPPSPTTTTTTTTTAVFSFPSSPPANAFEPCLYGSLPAWLPAYLSVHDSGPAYLFVHDSGPAYLSVHDSGPAYLSVYDSAPPPPFPISVSQYLYPFS